MSTRRGLSVVAAFLLPALLILFVLGVADSFTQVASHVSSVPGKSRPDLSALVSGDEEKGGWQSKHLLVQVPSSEWIIWETAASPQSLLLEGDRLWVGSHGGGLYRW
ncbi:MAG: hypothetical protein MN733_31800, partial [Nitrososphaera sp.]|nr:hypothetical protein [Nitrososphaera sp.]